MGRLGVINSARSQVRQFAGWWLALDTSVKSDSFVPNDQALSLNYVTRAFIFKA